MGSRWWRHDLSVMEGKEGRPACGRRAFGDGVIRRDSYSGYTADPGGILDTMQIRHTFSGILI